MTYSIMESQKQSPYDFSSNATVPTVAFRERFWRSFLQWLWLCGSILVLQSLIFWVLHGNYTTARTTQAYAAVIKIGLCCCIVASIAIVPFRNRVIIFAKYVFWSLVHIFACYAVIEIANASLGAS